MRVRQCVPAEAEERVRGFETIDQAFITANPGIDYQTINSTTDAVRAGPQGEPIFPESNFRYLADDHQRRAR